MNGILAPLNEKRKEAAVIVSEAERLPVKDLAIRALTRAGLGAFEFDSVLAQSVGELIQIVAVRGPTDEARFLELVDDGVLLETCLLRIGSDDFQVAARAKREQGVLRAAARMNSAKSGVDSYVFLNKCDAFFEIVAPKKNVVEP